MGDPISESSPQESVYLDCSCFCGIGSCGVPRPSLEDYGLSTESWAKKARDTDGAHVIVTKTTQIDSP